MKRIGGQKDSFADQPSHPKGRAAISLRQEPGSLQDELNDPAPRCWRKVLVFIVLEEIVFGSRVGGGVVLLVFTGEEVGIWLKRPLNSLQPPRTWSQDILLLRIRFEDESEEAAIGDITLSPLLYSSFQVRLRCLIRFRM